MKKNIIFRVDFSKKIGYGHLMKTLPLAEEFQKDDFNVIYVCKNYKLNNFEVFKKYNFKLYKLRTELSIENELLELNNLIKKYKPLATIVEGYHFGYDYQKEIDTNLLVSLGSNGDAKQYVDLVINPNLWSDKSFVSESIKNGSLYINGSDYIMVRDDFINQNFNNELLNIKKIMITLGGSKSQKYIKEIYNSLKRLNIKLYLIGDINIENNKAIVVRNSFDLSNIMRESDLIISGSGNTTLEIMAMKRPFLYYKVAENQINQINYLKNKNVGKYMGDIKNFNSQKLQIELKKLYNQPDKLNCMISNQQKISDFKGAKRLKNLIINKN